METLFAKIAEQIPALGGLGVLVYLFLDHINRQAASAASERKAEREERAIERANLHVIVERNTAAHERSIGVMTHMEHVLRRLDGDNVPHTGSHIWTAEVQHGRTKPSGEGK